MNKPSIIYSFNISAPYPDENGVAKQGTAFRIESLKVEARAKDIKDAAGYILRHEKIADMFKHNGLDIENIIEQINPKEKELQSIFILNDTGLVLSFSLKEKNNE